MSFRWRSVVYLSCFIFSLVLNPLSFSVIMRRRSVRCSKKFSFCLLLCFTFSLRVSLLFCDPFVGFDISVGRFCLVALSCICLCRV
jgi:hypothetical protein